MLYANRKALRQDRSLAGTQKPVLDQTSVCGTQWILIGG